MPNGIQWQSIETFIDIDRVRSKTGVLFARVKLTKSSLADMCFTMVDKKAKDASALDTVDDPSEKKLLPSNYNKKSGSVAVADQGL